jgi:hypothetical protein
LKNFFSCYETQQLILGTGTAIWWVTEPHCVRKLMKNKLEKEGGKGPSLKKHLIYKLPIV